MQKYLLSIRIRWGVFILKKKQTKKIKFDLIEFEKKTKKTYAVFRVVGTIDQKAIRRRFAIMQRQLDSAFLRKRKNNYFPIQLTDPSNFKLTSFPRRIARNATMRANATTYAFQTKQIALIKNKSTTRKNNLLDSICLFPTIKYRKFKKKSKKKC